MMEHLHSVLAAQKARHGSGATLDISSRRSTLETLKRTLLGAETELGEALSVDLGKPQMEVYTSELGYLLAEIGEAIRRLRKWSRPHRVPTPLFLRPGRGWKRREPYGSVLVLGPWNYPLNLTLVPVVAALAAGNSVVVKPSEIAPATARVLERLLNNAFDPNTLYVVTGGPEIARQLTSMQFDYIFFTGSTGVGRAVYESAARQLIPVTLELGGKNPCIVHSDAVLEQAARRIVWGKFFNAGQTCVAPDTLLVHAEVRDTLITKLRETINAFYGPDPRQSADYGRIINDRHFARLTSMLSGVEILHGGATVAEERYIEPTLVALPASPGVSVGEAPAGTSALRTEEIFGPILPVIEWSTHEELAQLLAPFATPLAFYLFSADRALITGIERRHKAGSLVLNDTFSQISIRGLPFGGVGSSGFGSYHGEEGFRTFTRPLSVYRRSPRRGLSLAFPPYRKRALAWIRRAMIR